LTKITKPAETRDNLAQQFESLASEFGLLERKAGNVAARSGQIGDETVVNRIGRQGKDNRDDWCRLLCCDGGHSSRRDNDLDLESDKLGRDLGGALAASLRPAIVDRDRATLDPAKFAQSLHKRGDPLALSQRWTHAHESDGLLHFGWISRNQSRIGF
jgi:hypothetical protein